MKVRGILGPCVGTALVLALAGCGGAKDSPLKVEGFVTLDGKPLSGATVQFVPITKDSGGHLANGITGSDGSFRLTTYNTGDGALPGEYKIVITPGEANAAKKAQAIDPSDSKAMAAAMKRAKEAQKRPSGNHKVKGFPSVYSEDARTPLKQRVPTDGPVTIELKATGG